MPTLKRTLDAVAEDSNGAAAKKERLMRMCLAPECAKPANNNGVCETHDHGDKEFSGGACSESPKGWSIRHCAHDGCRKHAQDEDGKCTLHGGGGSRSKKKCSHEGCENNAAKDGICIRHGAVLPAKPQCSYEGCTNRAYSVSGGVCRKHTVNKKQCSVEGCETQPYARGLCFAHGGSGSGSPKPRKKCSSRGCPNRAEKGGICIRHGAVVPRKPPCSYEGCTNRAYSVSGGVCRRHTVNQKQCSVEGCDMQPQSRGRCFAHGGSRLPRMIKMCNSTGCRNRAGNEGVCTRHGAVVSHKFATKGPRESNGDNSSDEYDNFVNGPVICQLTADSHTVNGCSDSTSTDENQLDLNKYKSNEEIDKDTRKTDNSKEDSAGNMMTKAPEKTAEVEEMMIEGNVDNTGQQGQAITLVNDVAKEVDQSNGAMEFTASIQPIKITDAPNQSFDTDDEAEIVGPWGTFTVPSLRTENRKQAAKQTVDSDEEAEMMGPWGMCTVPYL